MPRRGADRCKRERKPREGMMLHQDASREAWLQGRPPLDLVVTMDDATGTIYSANLITEGCLAFEASQFPKLKAKVAAMIRREGAAYLHVGKDGASITSHREPGDETAIYPRAPAPRAPDAHASVSGLHGAAIAPAVDNAHLERAAALLDHIHGRMHDILRMSASARQSQGGVTRVGALSARLRGGFASAGSSFG